MKYIYPYLSIVSKMAIPLEKLMCKWFLVGCKNPDCGYAHSFDELKVKMCRYGDKCKELECTFFHPGETLPSGFVLKQIEKERLSKGMTEFDMLRNNLNIDQFEFESIEQFLNERDCELSERYFKLKPKKYLYFENVVVEI